MNLPPYDKMKVRQSPTGKTTVYDVLRKRYVKLTPEEMVRQFFINYLVKYRGYPANLMANEVELTVGEKHLRCDSILYGLDMNPRMIIEYKAPNVAITEKVLHQILSYNTLLHVPYLIMSNGSQHVCMKHDAESGQWVFLQEIPMYECL